MKGKLILLSLAIALCFGSASAQSRKAVRINEVMVENTSNVVDDYGEHVGWIELYNTNYAPINIASMYLSTNPEDTVNSKEKLGTMYAIPKGDQRTLMGKRQTVIFFADGEHTRGTFHTNFTLKPGETNWVLLFDTDGTLVDKVEIPANLQANSSYAYTEDENGEYVWSVRNGETTTTYITPGGENKILDTNKKIDVFATQDKNGFNMAIMAMGIVFSALLVLCIAFMIISKIGSAVARGNKARSTGVDASETHVDHDSGEEIAAIAMALQQHLNAHDKESTVITINKVKRAYSPWSSKIYGLRQMPK